MPITLSDLLTWEKNRDFDKFNQIFYFLVEDQFAIVRIKAVEALGRMKDIHGLPCLLKAVDDANDRVSEFAYRTVLQWAKDDINIICEYLESPGNPHEIIRIGLTIISAYFSRRVLTTYYHFLKTDHMVELIQKLIMQQDDYSQLISDMSDPDPVTRYCVISAIRKSLKNPVTFQIISSSLIDENVQIRSHAEKTLAKFIETSTKDQGFDINPYKVFSPQLINNLHDEDYIVRSYAISALTAIGEETAVDELLSLINDPYSMVRFFAIKAFGKFRTEKAFQPLKDLYKIEASTDNRKLIIYSITKTGHSGVFAFLKRIIEREKNRILRENAIEQIGYVDDKKAFTVLKNVIDKEDSTYLYITLNAIADLNDPRAVELALRILENLQIRFAIYPILKILSYFQETRSIIPLLWFATKQPSYYDGIVDGIEKIIAPHSFQSYVDNHSFPGDSDFLETFEKVKAELIRRENSPNKFCGF